MSGFKKAVREQIWVKALLGGPSGSGKSYSALLLGKGLVSKTGGRIAYIGTEGSRDKYYSNEFDYDLLQLEDPFTPEKYIDAIDQAIDNGYKVLIIDSISHEWKTLNDIHDKMPGNSFTNWGKLKSRHRAFMEKILYSPIHVISTGRGKDEWVLEEKDGKKVPKKVGMGLVADKEISFEYTISLTIQQDTHIATCDKDNTKLWDNRYEVITEKDGVALYEWANSGEVPAIMPKMVYSKVENSSTAPSETSSDDALKTIKSQIVAKCTELGGTKNETLMATLKEYVSSGNPNAIRSIDKAQELLEKLNNMNN